MDHTIMKKTYTVNDRLVYLAVSYIEAEHQAEMPAYAQIIRRFIIGKKESAFYEFFAKHPDVCGRNRKITFGQVEEILEKLCKDGLLKIDRTGSKGNIYSTEKGKRPKKAEKTPEKTKAKTPNDETSYVAEIRQRIQNNDLFREQNASHIEGTKLMTHQKAGAALAAKYDRFAFFYDTGTGKTIMTLNIIAERYAQSGTRFLIVAPKPLIKSAWLDDAKFFPHMRILPISSNFTLADYRALYNKWAVEEGEPPARNEKKDIFFVHFGQIKLGRVDIRNA